MNKFHIIIPARMKSTRLPNKMTLDLGMTPLIVQTARQALKSNASQVIVATDHIDILNICNDYNIHAIMTKESHSSGTERLAEAAVILGLDQNQIIVNVQGDEPLINPELINQLAEFTIAKKAVCATIAHGIETREEIFNPNVVKVVLDKNSNALYFSRAPIPFFRDGFNDSEFKLPKELNLLRHVGMYAYSAGFIKEYIQMPTSPIEKVEALEQLRILYNGYKMAVLVSNIIPETGVDTIEDLHRARQILNNKPQI